MISHHQQHFSIRNYAFTSRQKHIEKSWPFSQQHLHLFSNHHDIRDLLPPFEPPDSIGTPLRQVHKTLSTSPPSDHAAPQNSQSPFAPHQTQTSLQLPPRKCRFILKLSPTQTQDIASNTTTTSASMSSKLCPVCRTFSSTSNTTLNAHIDHCLAVDTTPNLVINHTKLSKHITKPAKKRSMVEIYATAPRCTLEELDRRNGSNWATHSNLLSTDYKRQRLYTAHIEGTGDESPVYFDSNGTKLRIISNFGSGSLSTAENKPTKFIKNGKQSKTISFEVKKHSQSGNAKCQKLKPSVSLESDEAKISGTQKVKSGRERGYNKESCLFQLLKARDGIGCSESGTLRQWGRSKRTVRLKRVCGKDNLHGLGFSPSMLVSPSIETESNEMILGDLSPEGSSILSKTSEDAVSPPKSLHVDNQFYESRFNCEMEWHTGSDSKHNPVTKERTWSERSGCFLKLPKSLGMFTSSPRSKRAEVFASPADNSNNFARDSNSTLSNELVVNSSLCKLKNKLDRKKSASKESRITSAEVGQQVGAQVKVAEQYDYALDSTADVPGVYKVGPTHNSNVPNDKVRPEQEDVVDIFSSYGAGVLTPTRGVTGLRSLEWRKPMTTEDTSRSGAVNRNLVMDATIESYVNPRQKFCIEAKKIPDKVYTANNTCSKKVVPFPISKSCKRLASELCNMHTSLDAGANPWQSTGKHKRRVCGKKKVMPLLQRDLGDKQKTHRINDACGIGEHIETTSELNAGVSLPEGQLTRRRTDPRSFPTLPGSIWHSSWDESSEDLQENTSLTSSKMLFSQDRHKVDDRDSSESPVSGTSIIYHPTVARSELKLKNLDSCAISSAVNDDRFILGFSSGSTEPIVRDALVDSAKRAETNSPTEESVKFTDDHPCCCLWRNNHSCDVDDAPTYNDSQLKQCMRELSKMPAKGDQMSYNMDISPDVLVKPNSFLVSTNSASPYGRRRLTSRNDFSPSGTFSRVQNLRLTTNPVLRLMGKNLMVINKEEDAFAKLRQSPPGASNTCASSKHLNRNRSSCGSVINEDYVSPYSVDFQ